MTRRRWGVYQLLLSVLWDWVTIMNRSLPGATFHENRIYVYYTYYVQAKWVSWWTTYSFTILFCCGLSILHYPCTSEQVKVVLIFAQTCKKWLLHHQRPFLGLNLNRSKFRPPEMPIFRSRFKPAKKFKIYLGLTSQKSIADCWRHFIQTYFFGSKSGPSDFFSG